MTTIILCAVDQPLHVAWSRHCGDLGNVEVHQGSILEARCDAVVSPANSFGFMDGGIDMVYSQHFGWHVQERLQQLIRTKHHGELLVGNAEIVETENLAIPFLIAAPTMRIPTILRNTVNPYLAARAVLLLIRDGVFADGNLKDERISDAVTRVAFPGLGTGVGQVPRETCARQVRAAIDQVMFDKPGFPISWADASERHQRLYSDRVANLRFDG
jgi:O-acetyl-ADP-ribose deacetylase (regulator of RNase III)